MHLKALLHIYIISAYQPLAAVMRARSGRPAPCGLRGVTYSEFDNKVGPRLKFQFPANAISPEEFESFAEYVIVGKHLCGKIIAVRGGDLQFANYSVAIDNPKYDRNTLLFAVGFVLDKDIDTVSHHTIIYSTLT